jgi:hypothetical protein
VTKDNLGEILFGPREIRDADPTSLKKEKNLAEINGTAPASPKPRAGPQLV